MKIFTLTKMAAVSTFIALGASSATISAEVVNFGNLEPGIEYSWPQFATVQGVYTPKETGSVKFVYDTTIIDIYTSPDHNDDSKVSAEMSYTSAGKVMTYSELKAGTPYYVYLGFAMDAGSLIIYEGSSELKLVSTDPSIDPESPNYYGGKMSASSHYEMVVDFNFPITYSSVVLIAPDNSRVNVTAKTGTGTGTSIGCDISPAMMQMYKEGKIKEGDKVTLSIFQVTDASDNQNKFNGNGRCDIPFTVAAKPIELVEVIGAEKNSIENVFDSYYLPGDENALIKFVFDGPLSTEKTGVASMSYGNSDNLDVGVYYEDVTGVHDENTATFDFSGKRRRPIDMLPASTPETQPNGLGISFGNLYSSDGQRAYTGSKSNPNGYAFSFVINTLQYTIVGDFTPARGTTLTFGQPMEIWVMNGEKIKYDTIRFDYTEGGEAKYYDMPENEVKEESDPLSEGAMLYTFNIPTLPCDEGTPVTVRMTGIQCADGLDHSNDVFGDFKQATAGIADVSFSDSDILDVYDIAGVRVLSGVKREALSSLAKGIYVINGKKIVIR